MAQPEILGCLWMPSRIGFELESPGETYPSALEIFEQSTLTLVVRTTWHRSGVWERIFKVLADDEERESSMIDATIVRAHQHSAGALKTWTQASDRTE